jgi:hypothetical protein
MISPQIARKFLNASELDASPQGVVPFCDDHHADRR